MGTSGIGIGGKLRSPNAGLEHLATAVRSRFASPPSLKNSGATLASTLEEPKQQDMDQATVGIHQKDSFGQVVGSVAALALSLAPQAAKAQQADKFAPSIQSEVTERNTICDCDNLDLSKDEQSSETTDAKKKTEKTEECCEGKKAAETEPEKEKNKWQPLKGQILPPVLTNKRKADLGEGWNFSIEPIDIDVQPRWEDGPAVKFRGDFLESRIQKNYDLGNEWTMNRGFHGKIRGEVKTYDKPILDLELGAFQEWRGPLTEDVDAKFSAHLGFRSRFVGKEDNEGLSAGLSLRQELEGADFKMFGDDYRWYVEGRQHISRNFSTSDNSAGYRFMVGPKRDLKVSAFGKTANITVAAGPEFKGDSGDLFNIGFKTKIKIKL